MPDVLTPRRARELRQRNGWSLQELASHSGINKPYLSEFENGRRELPAPLLAHLTEVLENGSPVAGRARPSLLTEGQHSRLVFVDNDGREQYRPPRAYLVWEEDDGSSYKMYIGER